MSNAMPGTHTFTLVGADGAEHTYLVLEHPAGDGMEIMYALLGLGAPSMVGLASAALKSVDLLRALWGAFTSDGDEALATRIADADWSAFGKLLKDFDLTAVGVEAGKALATGKAPELTRKILSRTHRDGQNLSSADTAFERAYQANYAELLQAVWKVCTINRFFPVPSMSAVSSAGK